MTLGSLFDGIGGWLLAARHAGVTPVWASEIEPFPQSVTAWHFPDVRQLGDITQIDPDEIEPVDIVCAGSPCQDLSIAGKRKGLDGARSGLFRKAVDIVRRIRASTGGGDTRASLSGRTSPGHSQAIKGLILEPCLRKSDRPKFQYLNMANGQTPEWLNATSVKSHGASSTRNIGECPNVAVESFLSRILQPMTDVLEKYYLSAKACLGILRRAKERGKELPEELRIALERQANISPRQQGP
ncbi:hypothetical protein AXE86_05950 [Selenomonas sp. oral taxon 136]|nr:hypothetical protein AXE86_05950 [Selenomonas sp. oral taxon 136]